MTNVGKLLNALRGRCDCIDWNAPQDAQRIAREVLTIASTPENLGMLFDNFTADDELVSKSKHFNLFSKIVLLKSKSDNWKLRLHIFEEEVLEAHHHQASFCAGVLRGSYQHLLFGPHKTLEYDRLKQPLNPLFVHNQEPGSIYFIDHDMVHASITAEPTTTLMLQGPKVRDSFEIFELEKGTSRIRTDVANGSVQEPGEYAMSGSDLTGIRGSLAKDGLLQ